MDLCHLVIYVAVYMKNSSGRNGPRWVLKQVCLSAFAPLWISPSPPVLAWLFPSALKHLPSSLQDERITISDILSLLIFKLSVVLGLKVHKLLSQKDDRCAQTKSSNGEVMLGNLAQINFNRLTSMLTST